MSAASTNEVEHRYIREDTLGMYDDAHAGMILSEGKKLNSPIATFPAFNHGRSFLSITLADTVRSFRGNNCPPLFTTTCVALRTRAILEQRRRRLSGYDLSSP
jgi:hypothetical protein